MTSSIPRHRAAWSGEQHDLRSGEVTLRLFRRTTGWGWGEISDHEGGHLAVLEHLGELAVRDAAVPMRLEAEELRILPDGAISFDVKSLDVAGALAGSSFDSWIGSPLQGNLLHGTVIVTPRGGGVFELAWDLECTADIAVEYLRGPWLSVGRGSFGAARDDAILPGIEWALGEEWTSGDDWFRDPWAMRATPPVDSVAVPVMAVSHAGRRVSLEWEPDHQVAAWFTMPRHRLQPVFASPDFVQRAPASLLGLMIPETEGTGDQWRASAPLELHRGQRLAFRATLVVGSGDSLDAVADYVGRHGLPDAGVGFLDEVHQIADTFATNLWHPGRGFGVGQVDGDIVPDPPPFVARYLRANPDRPEARRLRALVGHVAPHEDVDRAALESLLQEQSPDGSFVFDPEGRHRSKDDFVVARDLVAPMGLPGETALDMTVLPALQLLRAYEAVHDERFADAARRALDAARVHTRPAGGDYWETPLHAPNLLAAGHAAVAYAKAFALFGDDRDRVSACRWMRSLLVFTHLWEPRGRPMLYNTKPCLCSSDWYFANWVRDHVQWEIIEIVALAAEMDVDLERMDPELDWDRYFRGVVAAGVRWLIRHDRDDWRPHNIPSSIDRYRRGGFDGCLPDTHNSTTGLYGGMAIPPGRLGDALLALRAGAASRPGAPTY